MPKRKQSRTKRKTRRRGAGIRDWIRKAHTFVKSKRGYSRAASYAYNKYGKPMVGNKLSKSNAALVNKGVAAGLSKLRQSGYGLRRAGMGLRLSGNGRRMKF